jgi:hypothetical protein
MMLIYFVAIWNIYGHLGYFMTPWYVLCLFGAVFPVLVSCTKKNLATLGGGQENFFVSYDKYFELRLAEITKRKAYLHD